MFDEPKKELNDLDAVLQSLDQKDEFFEDFYAQILEEYGDAPAEQPVREAPPAAAPVQKAQPADSAYADKKKAPPVKKSNAVRNLSIVVIAELLGIAGIAAYWFFRLL